MEEDALLGSEPRGEGGKSNPTLTRRARGLLLGLIALLEEIGGAATAPEFVAYGVVGAEILIAVETGYLMKRPHKIWG